MEKVGKESWLLSPADILYFLILLFLPTQFGRHFWPDFSYVSGFRIDYLSPTLYVTDILIILLFIFWFLLELKSLKKVKLNLNLSMTALFIFLVLGIFLSRSPLAGLYGLLKLAEFSFFGFYTMKNIRNMKLVVIVLYVGLFFESLLSIAQYFNQGSLGSFFYFLGERTFTSQTPGIANASINGSLILRPYATFSHPNVLAAYLILSMTFLLFTVKTSISKKMQAIYVALFLLGTSALFLTLSRTAIITWIAILCLYLFRKRWKLALGFCVFIGALIYISPFGARFLSFSPADEAFTQRISLSKAAVEMFIKNPIFGVGINNFLPNLPFYIKQVGNTFFLQPVHNIFLLVLSETGIIGFGFFTWFLVKTYKRVLKRKSILGLVLISEVIFLGFFDHYFLTLQQGQLLLALVLGLCWSSLQAAKSDTIN